MTIIETIEKNDIYSVELIQENDGTYTFTSPTISKYFKTLAGAKRYVAKYKAINE